MTIHVVKRGESVWAISKKYGVSIAVINQVNGLPSTNKIVPVLPYTFQKINYHYPYDPIKLKQEIFYGKLLSVLILV